MNKLYVQRCKSEYLLKSAVNIARSIIALDKSTVDPPKDSWGEFRKGIEVPVDILGISDANTTVGLEINGVGRNLPISTLANANANAEIFVGWRDTFVRLFENLEFDNDGERDQSGLFPNRIFTSKELVANLIDYMDSNSDSYTAENFPDGIESIIPEGRFPNRKLETEEEILAIPGFTPRRVKKT